MKMGSRRVRKTDLMRRDTAKHNGKRQRKVNKRIQEEAGHTHAASPGRGQHRATSPHTRLTAQPQKRAGAGQTPPRPEDTPTLLSRQKAEGAEDHSERSLARGTGHIGGCPRTYMAHRTAALQIPQTLRKPVGTTDKCTPSRSSTWKSGQNRQIPRKAYFQN